MGSVLDKNSSNVKKRIERHVFEDDGGEEYEGSEFNGFGDYFRRKKIKLQNLDADIRAASDCPQIFKGVVAHATGYTQPPLHILHREVVQHGGGFLQYLDSKTMATHIIASTLPPKKSVEFNRYRIVKPAWIMDSVAAGRLLPWNEYRVLDEGPRQKVLQLDSSRGLTQSSSNHQHSYRDQIGDSFYTNQFKGLETPRYAGDVRKTDRAGSTLQSSEAGSATRPRDPEPLATLESPSVLAQANVSAGNSRDDGSPFPKPRAPVLPVADPPEPDQQPGPQPERPKDMTSEEHNAWLLSDPRMAKSSTANPEFLKQYYSESRLHHLSTWKAELKSKMQRLAAAQGPVAKAKRPPGARRYVMHVDFDSFFCAVSLKANPEYVDKPAVVAHGNGTGSEIASCNYPAREFGVKNGMWMKRALELCPDLKVLPYDFPAYEETSRLFYECILSIGGIVQSVSVDEALIDVTDIVLTQSSSRGVGMDEGSVWREQDTADQLATTLRNSIRTKTGCEASVGIGGNILQAKVALRRGKPAGQFQLQPEDVLDIVGDLKVEGLPGVAYSIGAKLEEIGVKLVKDLRDVSKDRLTTVLGPKTSEKLRDYSRGIDRTEVGEHPPRKSVSAEVNWGIRFLNQPEAEEFVYNLCKELEKRLKNEQVRGKQLTMKIMRRSLDAPLDPAKHLGHGKCDTFNKSTSFGVAIDHAEAIGKEAVAMLRSFKFSPGDLRGLGVQMTKLEPVKANAANAEGSQRRLTFGAFAGPSPVRRAKLDSIVDVADSPEKARQEMDPIADDPITPRKAKVHPAMALARAGREDQQARTPLNVGGTQFIIPSNPDPAFLAELPKDIRSRLMAQHSKASRDTTPVTRLGSPSRGSPAPIDAVPSQVDAEVFNALPDDMKAEVLASYGRQPPVVSRPQSPRNDGVKSESRLMKPSTPTKRGRGRPRGAFGKKQRQRDAQAGLLQTNFRAAVPAEGETEGELEDLDDDFLSELPEDVRQEIMADHHRRRLARRAGLDAPGRRNNAGSRSAAQPTGQRRVQFQTLPSKAPFTGDSVLATQDVKDMLNAWHTETRQEGPHRRDVAVFEQFLARVVKEERDLEKATKLLRWLVVLVEQNAKGDDMGQRAWRREVEAIQEVVQGAVEERGLPRLAM